MAAGTPFAAAHTFVQSGPLRPGNLAPGLANVVFVGSGTRPDSPTFDYSPSQPTMAPPPTTPEYGTGTCLSGTLPDSSVPEPVGPDVTEVPCTSPDAHYRVIQDIPGTTDLHRCDSNSQTQYEFSSEEDINGVPTDQYVYCLVGIGSYAR